MSNVNFFPLKESEFSISSTFCKWTIFLEVFWWIHTCVFEVPTVSYGAASKLPLKSVGFPCKYRKVNLLCNSLVSSQVL